MSEPQVTTNRREHWRQLIEEWQSSGETISGFCRQRGLTLSSFYQWRRCLFPKACTKQDADASQSAIFLPVQVRPDSKPAPMCDKTMKLSLQYPNGCVLHFDGQCLNREVLSSLNKAMGV